MTVNYRAAKATERLLCVTGIPRGDNRSVAVAARHGGVRNPSRVFGDRECRWSQNSFDVSPDFFRFNELAPVSCGDPPLRGFTQPCDVLLGGFCGNIFLLTGRERCVHHVLKRRL
jgi:hypothetical protein